LNYYFRKNINIIDNIKILLDIVRAKSLDIKGLWVGTEIGLLGFDPTPYCTKL